MVHLTGIVLTSQTRPNLGMTDAEQGQNGLDIHAGMSETSEILFLHPELVAPGYQGARPHPGSDWRQLVNRGASAGWPGYFGAPALAQAWRGAALLEAQARDLSDGSSPGSLGRFRRLLFVATRVKALGHGFALCSLEISLASGGDVSP